MEQTVGYGEDVYSEKAREAIKEAIGRNDVDVHFMIGGAQTNATIISSALRPYQGVISPSTGHINVHETGAVEHTGHKVIALPAQNGKISAAQIEEAIKLQKEEDGPEHMVEPAMAYISFPTEVGSIYTKHELEAIATVCRNNGVYLFIDGARLGYGLCSLECDLTIRDISRLSDVFYIGGTKVGALFGEAVVIVNDALKKDFRYNIKQNGGMLAKGRLLGIQFLTLFTNNLYMEISQHGIDMAMKIKKALTAHGYKFYADSPTNQQFVIMSKKKFCNLKNEFLLSPWANIDNENLAVRICTSWATKEENVDKLILRLTE